MTHDEIIEMARQVGFSGSVAKMWAIYFEAFAKLIAAKYEQKIQDLEDMITELQERQT